MYSTFPVEPNRGREIKYETMPCKVPEDGMEIKRDHYDLEEHGSPAVSVWDASTISVSSLSYALASSDQAMYKMFEDQCSLSAMTVNNCHMIDQAKCDEVGLCSPTEKSNMLCCTPNTHRMLDAVSGGCPTLRIEPLGIDASDTVVDSKGNTRVRCNIRLHFRDLVVAPRSRIKLREESVKVDECTYDTFVHMVDHGSFVQAAAWKNQKTLNAWV